MIHSGRVEDRGLDRETNLTLFTHRSVFGDSSAPKSVTEQGNGIGSDV